MSEASQRRLFEAFLHHKGDTGNRARALISEGIVCKHGTVFQLFLPLAPVFQTQQDAVRTEPIDPSLKKVV